MVEKPDCGLCRKIKKLSGKKPDCGECLGTLKPENRLPFDIFWRCKNQVIMGQTLPLDLKIDVARAEIARYINEPDEQDYCFDLVVSGFSTYLEKIKQSFDDKVKP